MEPASRNFVIRPFGEAALLVEVADAPSLSAARRVHALAGAVTAATAAGIRSVTPGFTSLLVEFDPLAVERRSAETTIRSAAERVAPDAAASGRHRSVPVLYGGEHGPDLGDVARLTGLSPDEVVARHAGVRYEVYLLGFAPGFPYLGDVPSELEVPRLATPRTVTPAGSVAITGRYSGIYPVAGPGGWRVIGRTSLRLFDAARNPPAYLLPGDTVEFRAFDPGGLPPADEIPPDW